MSKMNKLRKVIKTKNKGKKSHQIKSISSNVSKSHKRKYNSSEDEDNVSHEAYKRKHVDSDCEKSLVLLANAAKRIIPDNETDDDCEKEAVFSADDDLTVESASHSDFPSFMKKISLYSDEEEFPVAPKPKKKKKRKETVEEIINSIERKSDTSDSESEDTGLFYAKRYESNGVSKMEDEKSKKNVRIQCVPLKNLEVVLLEHPASVAIYNYISVHVLSGKVSILGYQMDEESRPIKLFSSKSTGVLRIKTEGPSEIWKKDKYKEIKHQLKHFTLSESIPLTILDKCKNNTVIVVLQACIPSPSLKFINLYYPTLFKFPETQRRNKFALNDDTIGIKFTSDVSGLADQIIAAVCRSKVNSEAGPRILVYGNSNTGKSTLLKYLVNKVLNTSSVIYFDADPGQCEFTPPGVISFTEVTQPIIGPPFSHPRKPIKMVFTGSVTPAASPEMYVKSIKSLVRYHKSHRFLEPMFVNTVGWVQGLGIEILNEVVTAIKPTILIEILDNTSVLCDYRQFADRSVKYFQIRKQINNRMVIQSKDYRNLSILAYMGKYQSPYTGPFYLNEMKPYCISWDKIPVYVFNRRVAPNRLVESVNASVVALCRVLETSILESDVPEYTKTLEKEPENNCLGFGIVRAIDEERHLLYIVTPLSIDELEDVNAIMKGNIVTPPMIFTEQPITGQPLPFINKCEEPVEECKSLVRNTEE